MNGTLTQLPSQLRTEVLARAFWALGQPVRLRILEILLAEGEQTVGDLAGRLPVTQPQVSMHLASLTECGFTGVRREGRRAYYRVESPWVAGLLSLIRDHAEAYCEELLACVGCDPAEVPEELREHVRAMATDGGAR